MTHLATILELLFDNFDMTSCSSCSIFEKYTIKGSLIELKERAGIEAKTSPSNVLELVVTPPS